MRRFPNSGRRGLILGTLASGILGALPGRASTPGTARIDVSDYKPKRGEDALPAINAALRALARAGGGTLVLPSNGGYLISDTIRIRFSPCHIELHDDITLTSATKASAIIFEGLPHRPLKGVSVAGLGQRRKVDGNGRGMRGYSYATSDTFYSCVLFSRCTDWRIENIYAYNGLVGCIRAFFCGPGLIVDCDASHAEYDNGHSVDFDPSWLWGTPGPAGWSRAQIVRVRAGDCMGLGIASYAASGVTISDAEVWNCGNDEAGHPNNGGGISVEGNVGNPAKPDLQDRRCTILRAKIRDCWNQGLHISAVGATLDASTITGTRQPQSRANRIGFYGSNIIVFGPGTLKVSQSTLSASARHGIAMRVSLGQRPSLDFQGTISHARGSGIFAAGVARLDVRAGSAIADCGSSPKDAGLFVENLLTSSQGDDMVDIAGTISGSSGPAVNADTVASVNLHDIRFDGNFRLAPSQDTPVRLSRIRNLRAARVSFDKADGDWARFIRQTIP